MEPLIEMTSREAQLLWAFASQYRRKSNTPSWEPIPRSVGIEIDECVRQRLAGRGGRPRRAGFSPGGPKSADAHAAKGSRERSKPNCESSGTETSRDEFRRAFGVSRGVLAKNPTRASGLWRRDRPKQSRFKRRRGRTRTPRLTKMAYFWSRRESRIAFDSTTS